MAADRSVFLDATVLSNFASTGSIDWLVDLLDRPAVVPAVRDELDDGRRYGHDFLRTALAAIGGDVSVVESVDRPDDAQFRGRLDAGEAATIRSASRHGGIVATDDAAERAVARSQGITVTGSVGLLVLGIERGSLDIETADR